MFLIKITSDPSPESGIEIGDIFIAKSYWLDPYEKITLVEKVSGSNSVYEKESMNHYKNDCQIFKDTLQQAH